MSVIKGRHISSRGARPIPCCFLNLMSARAYLVMNGVTVETEFLTGDSRRMRELLESKRRRPGAKGRLVCLADGEPWLLAEPTFRPTSSGLTTPDVDEEIDRFHEQIILGDDVLLSDVFAAARMLLLANYQLSNDEVADLLEVQDGPEAETLAKVVLELLFGPDQRVRTYTDWVRASLLANGLDLSEIPASAINDVLTILMSTNRAVPPSQFVDACRAAQDRNSLERLV
jgi:hypothetical protein